VSTFLPRLEAAFTGLVAAFSAGSSFSASLSFPFSASGSASAACKVKQLS